MKSYYDILNVKSNASHSEIKSQYRKLVRMYHPDVNSSIEAETIFKEINRAAEILLDDVKRKKYDSLRATYKDAFNSTYTNKKTYCDKSKDNSSHFTYNDLFKKKSKEQKQNIPEPKIGEDITVDVSINIQESILGCNRVISVATSKLCPKCKGRKFANGTPCSKCNGQGEIINTKKITIKIPPSIKNGAKLRIKNEGREGQNGGQNGNLYVIVNINQNSDLTIQNNIVYYNAQISPYMAILGGNLEVPTLWGTTTIKLPPLTKSNQSFKLVDVGVLNEKTNKKGEEIVNIIIQIPSTISDEEYFLYEKIRDINLKKKNARTIQS